MDEQTLRSKTLAILQTIAPEIEPDEISGTRTLRSQVDLDSMDWLNFLVALHQQLKVDIPESDYAGLVSLDDVVRYLAARLPG